MILTTPDYSPILMDSSAHAANITVSREKEARGGASWADNFYTLISLSGMSEAPVPVGNFVADCFSRLDHVRAVLGGHSEDVFHVWIMIDDWNPAARKEVYSVQKLVMKKLGGLHFDFYVIDIQREVSPEEMVTGIPVIFNRANKRDTHTNS
ncbi:MAG TPA: hypothetical protein VKH63_21310 [Candidatus Acidoferrum sp.]|nr:hypothetical protein [Candidatus Acidoferrum sp.]